MSLPVALQFYSLREEAQVDFRGTLEKVKEMGYDGVEFAGLFGNKPEDVKKMCEEIGLVPISAHVPLADMINDPEGLLADYAKIGCKFVVVPYVAESDRPGAENFENTLKNIENIGKVAKSLGLQLLYHNHEFEFINLNGKFGLDVIYDSIPADYLQTEIDVCWASVGGVVPAEYVKKYTGRAPVVHLKDYNGVKSDNMYELIGLEPVAPKRAEGFEFRPVGSGVQNFPEILDAAVAAGASWVVVEQDKPSLGLTPVECAKKSREYLKTLGW